MSVITNFIIFWNIEQLIGFSILYFWKVITEMLNLID